MKDLQVFNTLAQKAVGRSHELDGVETVKERRDRLLKQQREAHVRYAMGVRRVQSLLKMLRDDVGEDSNKRFIKFKEKKDKEFYTFIVTYLSEGERASLNPDMQNKTGEKIKLEIGRGGSVCFIGYIESYEGEAIDGICQVENVDSLLDGPFAVWLGEHMPKGQLYRFQDMITSLRALEDVAFTAASVPLKPAKNPPKKAAKKGKKPQKIRQNRRKPRPPEKG